MSKKINLHRCNIEFIIDNFFPSGSGFDCNYELQETNNLKTEKTFYIKSSYHCMNEHGGYDGYQDFTIKINKVWIDSEFTLMFNTPRYKSEKYQLRDYMEDTLHYHFSELFKKHGQEIKRNYYQREFDRLLREDKPHLKGVIAGGEVKVAVRSSISGATKWMNLNKECIDALNEYLGKVKEGK